MFTFIVAGIAAVWAGDPGDQAAHVNLALLNRADAEKLNGRVVSVWFVVGRMVVTTDDDRTPLGLDDQADGIERTVIVQGEHPGIAIGKRRIVPGTLRVICHPVDVVNGALVAEWLEIRVEESR